MWFLFAGADDGYYDLWFGIKIIKLTIILATLDIQVIVGFMESIC